MQRNESVPKKVIIPGYDAIVPSNRDTTPISCGRPPILGLFRISCPPSLSLAGTILHQGMPSCPRCYIVSLVLVTAHPMKYNIYTHRVTACAQTGTTCCDIQYPRNHKLKRATVRCRSDGAAPTRPPNCRA